MSTRTGATCSRREAFTVESYCDGQLFSKCCCKQHRRNAFNAVVSSSGGHFGHYERWNEWSGHINTHVTVTSVDIVTSLDTEYFHVGSRVFGPMTETDYLRKEHDGHFQEYSLIGSFNLRDQDDEDYPVWLSKYKDCKSRMREIETRLDQLGESLEPDVDDF